MDPALEQLLRGGHPADEVAVLLRLTEGTVPAGARIIAGFPPIFTARVRRESIPAIRAAEGVLSMKASTPLEADLLPPDLAEVEDVDLRPSDQRRPEGLEQTGRHVVLALADWGLDIAHPDLRGPDGKTRVLALWDQRARIGDQSNSRYGYGWVHDRQAIDAALRQSDPYAALSYRLPPSPSHGTHTAAIAAGSGRSGGPAGMAPDADLVFVDLGAATGEPGNNLGSSVALVEAMHFVATVAGRRPWVLNLSMGQLAGAHDASALTVQAIDSALATRGRCVLHSTGNYRSRPIHTQGVLRPGEVRDIGFHTGEEDGFAHEIDIWYSGHDRITVEVLAPSGELAARTPTGGSADLNYQGALVGRLYNRLCDPNNHDNEARLYLYPAAPRGAWRLRFRAVDVVDGRFHCWIERDQTCSTCQPAFDDADVVRTSTTNNICNGLLSIAVGAYDPHQPERPLAPFSSWGPTRDGRCKPDLVAPGVAILSARSAGSPPIADTSPVARMSGTSMAAPYVAGLVALMFQAAGRSLPTRRTRELLLKVAEPLAEDVPREGWGSGYAVVADAVAAAMDEAKARPRMGRSSMVAAVTTAAGETAPVETLPETMDWVVGRAARLAEDDRPVVSTEIQPAGEAAGGPVLADLSCDSAEAVYGALPIALGCDSAEATDEALPIALGCDTAEATDHALWTELQDGEAAAAETVQSPATTGSLGICRVATDITFATAKSFIRPQFKPVIEAAFIGAVDRPASGPVAPRADRTLLVTGHTDTQGPRAINNPLSQRRAQAAVAVLSQDADAWEQIGQTEGWWRGTAEIETMSLEVDGRGNDPSRIQRYQLDPRARLDLITRYLIALRPAWLPQRSPPLRPNFLPVIGSSTPGALGCGQGHLHNLRPGDVEENRRAEFYFFPSTAPAVRDCTAYRAWQSLCEDLITPQVELLDEYNNPYVGPFELTLPTGQVLHQNTDRTGAWSRPNLPAGRYTVTVRSRSVDLLVP